MAVLDVAFVQTKVLQMNFNTLVDALQANGWFGTVVVNADGTISINGNPLTSDQMSVLGNTLGLTTD